MNPHAGLVLAAGASQRMGRPKALLPLPDGRTLAQAQAESLLQGGCSDVGIVTGAHEAEISAAVHPLTTIFNAQWPEGRMTSVRAGLRAFPDAQGYLLVPVDAAVLRADTVAQILARANCGDCDAIRPRVAGRNGYALWLSASWAQHLLNTPPQPGERLDYLVDSHAIHLPINDPALLRNMNTPDEWMQFLQI